MIKTWVRGIAGFAALCCIYLISLFCFYYFEIPLPPALIGIFMLLIFLLSQRKVPTAITQSARPLLAHMALFLLPALISVLLYRDFFVQHYIALIIAVLLSTIVSLGITLWLSQRILLGVKTADQVTNSITNESKDIDQ